LLGGGWWGWVFGPAPPPPNPQPPIPNPQSPKINILIFNNYKKNNKIKLINKKFNY